MALNKIICETEWTPILTTDGRKAFRQFLLTLLSDLITEMPIPLNSADVCASEGLIVQRENEQHKRIKDQLKKEAQALTQMEELLNKQKAILMVQAIPIFNHLFNYYLTHTTRLSTLCWKPRKRESPIPMFHHFLWRILRTNQK